LNSLNLNLKSMPVQINELVVKGVVDQETGKEETKKNSLSAREEGVGKLSYSLRKQIIDQCTEEVMARLRSMNDI
jgi:hypothetical protein